MKSRTRIPIRLKFLLTLLLVVTGVVSTITFTMATLFHEDKTAYIRDLISLVGLSAAEESRSVLVGYGERLEVYARIMRDPDKGSYLREGRWQIMIHGESYKPLVAEAAKTSADKVFNRVCITHLLMDDAKEVKCSEFADALIANQ